MVSGGSPTFPERFIRWRPGELVLMLRPTGAAAAALENALDTGDWPVPDADLRAGVEHFFSPSTSPTIAGNQLSPQPFVDVTGTIRQVLPMDRGNEIGLVALLTVNLANWVPWPVSPVSAEDLDRALNDVTSAVQFYRALLPDGGDIGTAAGREGTPLAPDNPYNLVSVGPNWLSHALGCDPGSPAGRPVRPAQPIARYQQPDVDREVRARLPRGWGYQGRHGAGVRVAMFDTWPSTAPATPIPASVNPASWAPGSLQVIDNYGVSLQGINVVHSHLFHSGDGCCIEPDYPMPSHGWSVAGVIHQIAPAADIRVHRVLNDWGVDPLGSVFKAVAHAELDARTAGVPLVLNFSHGFGPDLLMYGCLGTTDAQDWAMKSCEELVAVRGDRAVWQAAMREFMKDPSYVFYSAALNGSWPCFAAGAAGNESDRGRGVIGPPGIPAAVPNVLSVSAFDRCGTMANYSNEDCITAARPHGVTAFGGSTVQRPYQPGAGGFSSYVMMTELAWRGGAVSAFDGSDLVPPSSVNVAQWAGTSFACAVASGLAACIWSETGASALWGAGGLTPGQLMDQIVQLRTPTANRIALDQY